ncbi:hypothetical protein [Pseudomonas sp. NPDC087690]|uniref:hypothetical protein n=1 Tax=Pseudomonas sp. NPDC087690 TaxID=3364446 RepID=UPI0037FB6A8A
MGVFEFIVGMVGNIAWPATALIAITAFSKPISASILRVRTAKVSKDGLHLDLEPLQRVLENNASPEEKKLVQLQSVVGDGANASGAYTLYSNRTIVVRMKVDLKAMTSSTDLVLPISMANEVTSVQVVGDAKVRVTALSTSLVSIAFDAEPEDRAVELIVTGL